MSVNFILETTTTTTQGENGGVVQRKQRRVVPTQINLQQLSSDNNSSLSIITLQSVIDYMHEMHIPSCLWNIDEIEVVTKVKLDDQYNVNGKSWKVPLIGVPLVCCVSLGDDCIVVRPKSIDGADGNISPPESSIPMVSTLSSNNKTKNTTSQVPSTPDGVLLPSSTTSSLVSTVYDNIGRGVKREFSDDGDDSFAPPATSNQPHRHDGEVGSCRPHRDNDVLFGPNSKDLQMRHPGNRLYRSIMARCKEELCKRSVSTTTSEATTNFESTVDDVAKSILDEVKATGARFMYKKGRGQGLDSWVVSSDDRAIQAIRSHLIKKKKNDDLKQQSVAAATMSNPQCSSSAKVRLPATSSVTSRTISGRMTSVGLKNSSTKPAVPTKMTSKIVTKKFRNPPAKAKQFTAVLTKKRGAKPSSKKPVPIKKKTSKYVTKTSVNPPAKDQPYSAVGRRFEIWCGQDNWLPGRVMMYDQYAKKHIVEYGHDGEEEWKERTINIFRNTINWC